MRRQDIAVGGILIIEHKALMIRRSETEHTSIGYWEFPKGKVEWGEDPETALKREYIEEVNLNIELGEVHHMYSNTYKHHEGDDVHFWEIEYIVQLAPGETIDNIKLSIDHDAYQFVDLNEANTLQKMYDARRQSLIAALTDKI